MNRLRLAFALFLLNFATSLVVAQQPVAADAPVSRRSLSRDRLEWPSWEETLRTVTLRDYNTRIVVFGTTLLGVAAGVVGVFMLLRGRSLMGDVVSHSTLPGIALAFVVMEMMQQESGKWLPGLLLGALLTGLCGLFCIKLILQHTRIKEDAALAIVLSVFFGAGMSLFRAVQYIPSGSQAGLNHFILGKTASMIATDVCLIAGVSLGIVVVLALIFKELSLLCFDERYAATQGWPVYALDLLLMLLVAGVTVIGLQSVGLLLVVALQIAPAAAARFWTDRLGRTTWLAACFGGGGACVGVLVSALYPRLAAGPVIVLTVSSFFLVSLLLGARRGVCVRYLAHRRLTANVGRQHILRALFEHLESSLVADRPVAPQLIEHIVSIDDLRVMRSWSLPRLRHLLRGAEQNELVTRVREGGYRLTTAGAELSHRVVRNHRLWELYLIEYADIAPSHVDRDADDIEHLLGADVVAELERLLSERYPRLTIPPSPHQIEASSASLNSPS